MIDRLTTRMMRLAHAAPRCSVRALALAALMAAASASALASGAGPLLPGQKFPVGSSPRSVAIGDLNSDGAPDLVVANFDSGNGGDGGDLSVLLGAGDGAFAAQKQLFVGLYPESVAIGDLDNDGALDLAVAKFVGQGVSILLGVGDGTFVAPASYGTGFGSVFVTIGDLNGDGNLDLVAAETAGDFGSSSIFVLLGVGDGTFASPTQYVVGGNPTSIAIGDLDGDGAPDLAVTNSIFVSVLLGAGDGTFGAATHFETGNGTTSVAIGDLNGDGNPDLAVANAGSDFVSVLLGAGDGAFADATSFPTDSFASASSVAIADLDSDGNLDLVITGSPGFRVGGVVVLLGAGDGTFENQELFDTGYNPVSVAIGDLDSDGNLDLAVVNKDGDDVTVLLAAGAGAGGPLFPAQLLPTEYTPLSVAIGDFDGDGNPDLAATGSAFGDSGYVWVFLGVGDGVFSAATTFPVGSYPSSVAIGDLDSDGNLDLAVADEFGSDISILLGAGDGTFADEARYPAGSPQGYPQRSIAIGDFDSDGALDLAVTYEGGAVTILLGVGDGTFAAATSFTTGADSSSVAIGDLNSDGNPDLAVANTGSDDVSILLGAGDGAFAAQTRFPAGDRPVSVAIGDLDSDGIPDLAVANTGSDDVSILLGAGDGSFATQVRFDAGLSPRSVAISDLDGDGAPDLAVTNSLLDTASDVAVLLGVGDGTFAPRLRFATGDGPVSVAIGDLNSDGAPDLAVANSNSRDVSVLLNQRDAAAGPADLNGDGVVNGVDLASLLKSWGACPTGVACPADLNADSVVNGVDLATLLVNWGSAP